MLEIRDLHVQFHGADHEAVRGIDLTVGDGEIVGLVGESGSGKTVTAMMISGLLRPEQAAFRGQILLDGRDLLTSSGDTLRSIQGRDICVVFQEPMSAMDPTMRIGPQVEECLRVHTDLPPGKRRELALQALRDVDLPEAEEVYRKYPHELSGGMLQRAMIAAAILPRPKLLLADEPTTALDVTIQAKILDEIKEIKRKQKLSVIFITHDLGVVANMADRICVMYAGKIVEVGTAREIFYSPAHPYTWALLSSMPDLETKERLFSIPGTPPNMIFPPKGDAFAERNQYAMQVDFEEEPPFFKLSDTHYAATWLLHPNAPKVEMPEALQHRIARMNRKEGV